MSNKSQDSGESRLRQHPAERFAAPEHVFDLDNVLWHLKAEPHPVRHGHRQIAVFKKGTVTSIVFDFDRGGELVEHSTHGLVTILVLSGRLVVKTPEHSHELKQHMMVVLDPDIAHSVHAHTAAQMLLTVNLDAERTAALS